jgi:hypothetical protein
MACDTVEKIKKLLTWEDTAASQKVFVVIIIAFLVLSFFPIRLIVCLGLIGKFKKGSTYYQRKHIGNKECCRIEIRNFFKESDLYTFAELFEDSSNVNLHKEKP